MGISEFENLNKNQEHLSALNNHLRSAVFSFNREGVFTYVNPEMSKITGYSEDELVSMKFYSIIHPDDQQMVKDRGLARLRGEKVEKSYEFRIIRKDGKTVWIEVSSSYAEINGEPMVMGSGININKRKRTEAELQREFSVNEAFTEVSTELLSTSISIDRISSIICNYALAFTDSSSVVVGMLNEESQSISFNSGLIHFKLTAHDNHYYGIWGHVINTCKGFYTNNPQMHYSYNKEDEQDMRIERFLAFPAKANNKLLGQICLLNSSRDFTDKDLRLIKKLTDLFALALYRVQAEKDMLKSKLKAEESDRLKTAFLANMSHEVRTPLNGILGFAELLKDDDMSSTDKLEYVDIIGNCARQLLTIMNDILDISKIEAGNIQIKRSEVDIDGLLMDLFAKFDHLKNETDKDIVLITKKDRSQKGLRLFTDPKRVEQVFEKLLSNALKFTEKGVVEFGYLFRNNVSVLFYVKDTGIGIPKDKADVVFESFRKADDSDTRKFGGAGLGLSITRNILNLLGGKIWLESEVNKGTTFFFTLPFNMISEQVGNTSTLSQSIHYNWNGKSILVAEDAASNYQFLETIIRPSGAEIIWAQNGKEAIEKLHDHQKIDLILMDIQMPLVNGYEATRQIKELRPEVPIIAQTAYALTEDLDKCMDAGCDDYIAKPIRRERLLKKMDNLIL